MKVILKADIKGVGKKNEIINASDGYVRNFLFPKNLAVEANAENMSKLQAQKEATQFRKDTEKEEAKKTAEKINKIMVRVQVKAGENGKIFGGVSAKDISDNLEKQHNIKVDKKKVDLKETIKTLGVHIVPHDIDAEQAVLGSMLTDKDAVAEAIETLKEEDFYRDDNKAIFEAVLNLYSKSEPVDIITLKDELESMGKFEQVGGFEYLANLPDKVPTTANVQKYIKIVEEKSLLRNLIKTANEIIDLGYSSTEDVEDIMDNAERKIFDIMQRKSQKGYTPIKEVLVESFTKLEELYNRKQHITGVPTGFVELDYKTAGLHGSELILVAARPAMGKTAFALNIAANAALRGNVPVAIFSLEMSKDQLVNRILCGEAMVDSNKVRTGKLEEDDWVKLAGAIGPLSESEIYIDDTPGISIMEIRTKCRKLKMEKNIGLVVIDYLQLVQGSNKRSGSREQEISEISRSLKILAKEINVPVIALSQLSRAVEQRPDHRPMLSDLRESGAIEQDADIVMFLYRDDYYNKESEKKDIAEVIIAKQRGGSTGTVELLWMGNYTKFVNLEKRFDD